MPESIAWAPEAGGGWTAAGEGWQARVGPRRGGGYEAEFTGFGMERRLWPSPSEIGRDKDRCKAWVRRQIVRVAETQRWLAYIGRPTPKIGKAERLVPRRTTTPGYICWTAGPAADSWTAGGEGWDAVISRRGKGSYQAEFNGLGYAQRVWPEPQGRPQDLAHCKRWVRRVVVLALSRQRRPAYRASPARRHT